MVGHGGDKVVAGDLQEKAAKVAFDDTTHEKQRNGDLHAPLQEEVVMPQAPDHAHHAGSEPSGDMACQEQGLQVSPPAQLLRHKGPEDNQKSNGRNGPQYKRCSKDPAVDQLCQKHGGARREGGQKNGKGQMLPAKELGKASLHVSVQTEDNEGGNGRRGGLDAGKNEANRRVGYHSLENHGGKRKEEGKEQKHKEALGSFPDGWLSRWDHILVFPAAARPGMSIDTANLIIPLFARQRGKGKGRKISPLANPVTSWDLTIRAPSLLRACFQNSGLFQ